MSSSSAKAQLTALVASTVFVGATVFGGAITAPLAVGPPGHVQRAVVLTAADDAAAAVPLPAGAVFNSVLKFFLDLTGIGQQSVAHALDPHDNTTIESLLHGLNLQVSSPMSDVFTDLGLNNFTVATALAGLGLPTTDSMDAILQQLNLSDVTLDTVFSVVKLDAGTTIAQLVNQLGLSNESLAGLFSMLNLGGQANPDMLMLLTALGLQKLDGLLPLLGLYDNTSLLDVMKGLGVDPATLTLGELLSPNNGVVGPDGTGFLGSIGAMTLGQLLNFNATTTLQNVIDGMPFEGKSLGDSTLGELLSSAQVNENEKFGDFLSSLQIGPNSSPLGDASIASVLDLLLPKDATGTVNGGVTDNSTLFDYLSALGFNNITVDQLLGLSPPDIPTDTVPDSSGAVDGLGALLGSIGS